MSNLDVKGLEELVARLETMGNAAKKTSNDALKAGGAVIVNRQKADAPYLTGEGRDALKLGRIRTAKSSNKYVQIGIPDGSTWVKAQGIYFQHYGFFNHVAKRYIAATLWMDKSFNDAASEAKEAMINELEKGLNL